MWARASRLARQSRGSHAESRTESRTANRPRSYSVDEIDVIDATLRRRSASQPGEALLPTSDVRLPRLPQPWDAGASARSWWLVTTSAMLPRRPSRAPSRAPSARVSMRLVLSVAQRSVLRLGIRSKRRHTPPPSGSCSPAATTRCQ
eukprot:4388852-Prymnesium_polylepis.1